MCHSYGRDCFFSVLNYFVLLGNALNSFYSGIYVVPLDNFSIKNYTAVE